VQTGKLIREVPLQIGTGFNKPDCPPVFSPNGETLAIANTYPNSFIKLIQSKTGDIIRALPTTVPTTALAISPDGQQLASVSTSNSIQLWDVETGKLIHRFEDYLATPEEIITSLVFSPDGKTLITSDRHGDIKIWTVPTD
jgi:WD40 repeat protein